MERYPGVRGQARVKKIAEAIEASGGRVIRTPDPTCAPFIFEFESNAGSDKLVCYAFTANKYRQSGRPKGEHRFQVKYGSDFTRPHELFIDPKGLSTTLMFGVHDSLDLFVAVDPTMHNPTWFSSSVEFKDPELKIARKMGWHGWERDRVAGGRRRVLPQEDTRTEVVIAFHPEHFLNYARFERLASGMDPGERLLLSDRIERELSAGRSIENLLQPLPSKKGRKEAQHPLLTQFGLSTEELMELIGNRFRLMAAVRGGVAEVHLGRFLKSIPGVSGVTQVDEDGQPDFEITFGGARIRIECKNVLRKRVKGAPRVDFQKTRAAKGNPCSRYYEPTQFEVLAACLHPLTEKWEFTFSLTRNLEPHKKCKGRLAENVRVDGKNWSADLRDILKDLP